ncbi:hypothetical protein V5O48_010313 [Marasmius crinis-equi]|uniref:Transmembrane protein n=1 Tax=Marasmius crinis-equi TaxID=585013 RepID=A0ABR3F8P8_9AGAR
MDSGTIQNETADQIGRDAYFSLIHMQSVTLAYGLYVPVAAAALQITWRRHVRRQVRRATTGWVLGLYTLIFLSTTAWFAIVASEQYLNFHYIFHPVNGNTPSLKERQEVVELLFEKLFSASPFLQGINAIIALANGFHTVAITIHAAGDATKVDGWQELDSSSMLVSLCVNVAATTLILVKVWQTRQMWGTVNLGRSTVYRILVSLTECGFLFCTIQAINASVSLHNGNSSLMGSLQMFVQSFAVMSPILAGMYPSIVLLIVRQQSAINGETDVAIFENFTIPNSEPKFNTTQHGHGHDLTSVIRFASHASDLESGNRNTATVWSRGDPVGAFGGSHAHCGEGSRGGASNKDKDNVVDNSDSCGGPPRGDPSGDRQSSNDYRDNLPAVETVARKEFTSRPL